MKDKKEKKNTCIWEWFIIREFCFIYETTKQMAVVVASQPLEDTSQIRKITTIGIKWTLVENWKKILGYQH